MPKIQQFYLCDACGCVIKDSGKGFVIQGNVYSALPNVCAGLIGNNFPEDKGTGIKIEEVRETVYCTTCLLEALNIGGK